MFSFHCYTQRELTPTQKSARKWQLRPFATSCAKDYEGHSLVQTSLVKLRDKAFFFLFFFFFFSFFFKVWNQVNYLRYEFFIYFLKSEIRLIICVTKQDQTTQLSDFILIALILIIQKMRRFSGKTPFWNSIAWEEKSVFWKKVCLKKESLYWIICAYYLSNKYKHAL